MHDDAKKKNEQNVIWGKPRDITISRLHVRELHLLSHPIHRKGWHVNIRRVVLHRHSQIQDKESKTQPANLTKIEKIPLAVGSRHYKKPQEGSW